MTTTIACPPSAALLQLMTLLLLQIIVCVGQNTFMNTTLGILEGFIDESDTTPLNVFYGVPFARPPLGELRFMPPVPADPWEGNRNATTKPNSCWQTMDTQFGDFKGSDMWNPNTERSEDCLYLNVWIPAISTPKPILVWIFGGGFWSGSSTLDVYEASKLAIMNDVIVVSINYRVGTLGFLYTGHADAPGNAGLLDQSLALQWVHDNAELMGGDPSKITIFGESAGAVSVGYHLLSPRSMHLINNAIMMSGSPTVSWGVQDRVLAMDRSKKLARSVSCPTSSHAGMMDCLRSADPLELVTKQWDLISSFFDVPIGPVVDGTFLTDHPAELLARRQIKNTSVIAGVVHDEGTFWLLYGFSKVFGRQDPNPINASQFESVVEGVLKPFGAAYQDELVKKLTTIQYYDSVPPSERTPNMYLDVLDDISGDMLFKCPVVHFSEQYVSLMNAPVYQYSFRQRLSNNPWPEWFGVAHGYEVEAFLGIPFLKPEEYTDDERDLSRQLMEWITAFAKTGDPGSSWPAYSSERKEFLEIKANSYSVGHGLRHRDCTFWKEDMPLIQDRSNAPFNSRKCPSAAPVVTSSSTLLLSLACIELFSIFLNSILGFPQ